MTRQKSRIAVTVALVFSLTFWFLARAGSLEPPGPPAPTMKTLSEVEPRIPIRASDMPLTITTPGSYYFTEAISTTGAGITIQAPNVTLDLMGFSLSGGTGRGIYTDWATASNFSLRNGTVANWQLEGVLLDGYNSIVENMHFYSNGLGSTAAGLRVSRDAVITHCTATNNSGIGLMALNAAVVSASVSFNNGSFGIYAAYSTVKDCTTNENHGGIQAVSSTVVNCTSKDYGPNAAFDVAEGSLLDSRATGFGPIGILVQGNGSTIANNTVRNANTAGIRVTAANCRIDGNFVVENSKGIQVTNTGNIVIRNTARNNSAGNFDIVAGNDMGPIGSASATASPWANLQF